MVNRIGGDAGTAIHTSVSFGIAANMTLAFPVDEFGRHPPEPPTEPDKRGRADYPAPSQEEDSKYPATVRPFLIREIPEISTAKILRLGAGSRQTGRERPGGSPEHHMSPASRSRIIPPS
jgi:hypothetical protein